MTLGGASNLALVRKRCLKAPADLGLKLDRFRRVFRKCGQRPHRASLIDHPAPVHRFKPLTMKF